MSQKPSLIAPSAGRNSALPVSQAELADALVSIRFWTLTLLLLVSEIQQKLKKLLNQKSGTLLKKKERKEECTGQLSNRKGLKNHRRCG